MTIGDLLPLYWLTKFYDTDLRPKVTSGHLKDIEKKKKLFYILNFSGKRVP